MCFNEKDEDEKRSRFLEFLLFFRISPSILFVVAIGGVLFVPSLFSPLTCRPELTMRLTALPPPPPTPMTLMRASPPVVCVSGVERMRVGVEGEKTEKDGIVGVEGTARVRFCPQRFVPPLLFSHSSVALSMQGGKQQLLTVGAESRRAPGRGARSQGLERAARRRRDARRHHRRRRRQSGSGGAEGNRRARC